MGSHFLAVLTLYVCVMMSNAASTPNIVLIMADDLGIGDVGCFGNDTIKTPNIDRLAEEGAKLTHNLAAASMCTPSRAAFLTGRYPIRFGMVPLDQFRVNFFTASVSGLPANETTVAELAKEQGYATAIIGKWHLGLDCKEFNDHCHHPLNQGFDYFYGMPLTNLRDFGDEGQTILEGRRPNINWILFSFITGGVMLAYALRNFGFIGKKGVIFILVLASLPACIVHYYMRYNPVLNSIVMRNYDVVEQPIRLGSMTERLVREGTNFLQDRSKDEKPFLLIMSWIQVHTALHATSPFKGRSAHGPYGDEVEEMDWSVGRILNALDTLGFTDNTFVYFTSDHGGHIEEKGVHGNREGGWNGIYRGGKGQGGMDGGIRVPTVARWPGHIPPGSVIDLPTSTMDVLPTVTSIIQANLPTDRIIDGVDISDILQGDATGSVPHDFLVHYCGHQIHAARYTTPDGEDVYKAFYGTPRWLPGTQECGFLCDCNGVRVNWHDPPLLYNIAKDPSETTPLDTNLPKYRDILDIIHTRLALHKESVLPVESQFLHSRLAPRFWLQQCCNWPSCSCVEEV